MRKAPAPRAKAKPVPVAISGEAPVPNSYQQFLSISADSMAEIEAEADRFMQDPLAAAEDIRRTMLIHMGVAKWIVRNPPRGRSGVGAVMKAMTTYQSKAADFLAALERVLAESKQQKQAGDSYEAEGHTGSPRRRR